MAPARAASATGSRPTATPRPWPTCWPGPSGLLVAAAALYPLSHLGFRDGLQALLKNFDIAREQFQRVAGTHWYELELTATDNLTLQPVQGRFPVVGVWQNGLIVEREGELRAVGPSQAHHNLYPLQARLIRGEPLRVVAERVAMSRHTLRWLVSRIDPSRPYFKISSEE
jgi:inner membrane protein